MKKIIPVFLLSLISFSLFAIPTDTTCISNARYFPALMNAIHTAQKSIYVCIYYISYFPDKNGKVSEILSALVDARDRGVTVEVILDRGYEESESGANMSDKNVRAYSFLKQNKIPVYFDDNPTLTHAKYIIIDEKTVISGSFNWSEQSITKNREDGYFINSQEIAAEKLEEFRKMPRYSPEPVKDAIPIPLEFLRNKELGTKMMVGGSSRIFDLYLLCQKKSFETGSPAITFSSEEIRDNFLQIVKQEPGRENKVIKRFVEEILNLTVKKYPFIKSFRHDPDKNTLVIELPSENKAIEDSLYLSPLYWMDGWHQRLSQRSKFCLLYILDKTSSGRMGRYFSQAKYDAVKEYGVSHTIFAHGTKELQRYNLIEKDINFRIGENNPNGFTLNDFYLYGDFQKALEKLKTETDPELFEIVSGLADSVNEVSDFEVFKRLISLGHKYGPAPLKQVLSLCKSHTNGISPYRQFAYVEQAIINAGLGKSGVKTDE